MSAAPVTSGPQVAGTPQPDTRWERAADGLLVAFPFLALWGNAAADIALVVGVLGLLACAALRRDIAVFRAPWFVAALGFWAWAMLCAALSDWPLPSLAEMFHWLRFPLAALALSSYLRYRPQGIDRMGTSMLIAVLTVAAWVLVARLTGGDIERVNGPLGMEKPGWYLLGFGLPALVWLRIRLLDTAHGGWLHGLLTVFVLLAIVAAYQVYVSIAMGLGVLLFSVLSPQRVGGKLALLVAAVLAVLLLVSQNSSVQDRFVQQAAVRLPWLQSSQYYDYWNGGLATARSHPLVGVGPDNYDRYCNAMRAAGRIGEMGFSGLDMPDGCRNHPHQRYIQIAAETGVPGLLLFLLLAGVLFYTALRLPASSREAGYLRAAALALLVVNFWPVSTFSEAFGQKLNIYYWFQLAWMLVFVHWARLAVSESSQRDSAEGG